MARVIPFLAVRAERDASVEAAWQRFVEANEKAKATNDIRDGIAAGKAYRSFLELFEAKK